MGRNEWTVPIVVGLLATAGAWLLIPAPDDGGGHEAAAPHQGTPVPKQEIENSVPFLFPFSDGPVVADDCVDCTPYVLAVAVGTTDADALARPGGYGPWYEPAVAPVLPELDDFVALSGNVSVVKSRPHPAEGVQCFEGPCSLAWGPAFRHWAWQDERYEGPTAQAVDVTLYAFTGEGLLALTNADAANASRFPLHPTALQAPQGFWYLGDGEAPAGTIALPPSVRDRFLPVAADLVGTPIGGIVTTAIDDDGIQAIFGGPLFVTVRLDAVMALPVAAAPPT